MNWEIVGPFLALIFLFRILRVGLLVWIPFLAVGAYAVYQYGFVVPVPQSVIGIYLGITLLALVAYVTSSRERSEEFFGPITRFLTNRKLTPVLVVLALIPPALAAWRVYWASSVAIEPPFFARTIHPSPPTTISVQGEDVDLINDESPYRELAESDSDGYRRHLESGRTVYYQNCFYCHGDALAGDGMFAYGLNPIPTNFQDVNVLPNFQETFFLWRVSKGGPGMPQEGGPWNSAMPVWEEFLTEQEIWEVILFLYDFTGYKPRAREKFHH